MTGSWNDFNDASSQTTFDLIPKGLVVPVRMTIKPGGHDDPQMGWTGGYATRGTTGSVYLNAEFVLLEGGHARRKVWTLVGLFSPKGPEWGNMGRSFVRGILNSARGLSEKDTSPQAQTARRINGFADLDGIELLAKIDVGKDGRGDAKNEIRLAVTPDQKDWETYMAGGGQWRPRGGQPALHGAPPTAPSPSSPGATAAATPAGLNRPSWAQ